MRALTPLTRPLTLTLGLCLLGCSSSASSRPLPERYDRPAANPDDLLLASFELGKGRGQVLEVVGTPEVQSVALHAAPAEGEPSFAGHEPHLPLPPHLSPPDPPERRWLVEVRYQGQDPVIVAAVDVTPRRGGLHREPGPGSGSAGVRPGQRRAGLRAPRPGGGPPAGAGLAGAGPTGRRRAQGPGGRGSGSEGGARRERPIMSLMLRSTGRKS